MIAMSLITIGNHVFNDIINIIDMMWPHACDTVAPMPASSPCHLSHPMSSMQPPPPREAAQLNEGSARGRRAGGAGGAGTGGAGSYRGRGAAPAAATPAAATCCSSGWQWLQGRRLATRAA